MIDNDFHKDPTLVDFEEENEFSLPSEIGGYKIESLLNKGGMSVLYLGLHPVTHEPITIKVLSNEYLEKPEMVERFMKEATIIELANHPNIVKLYGHGRWEGGLYIAMEFIQGISLRQMILQQTMSLQRALSVVMQIAHALTHLHVHGIIHRDLKPENILLTEQGGIKVIDFGIAAFYTEENKISGTKKRVMGTPAYMSPEQKMNPKEVSFQTDIYALGVVTYELVLGRLSHGHIQLSLMPKGLQKILAKALQADPKERYQDVVDLIKDLSRYLASPDIKLERRGSDYLGQLNEDLKVAQSLLVSLKTPDWPRLDMGFASNNNATLSSVYYDYYEHKGAYTIVMGESLSTGVVGLLYIAILRGMIRSLNYLIEKPKELISVLNELIVQEGKDLSFSLAYLTLFPHEDRFSYISCGYCPLWYLPSGADNPRRLSADNIALGITTPFDVLEIDSNWNVGDGIVMHTFQAGLSKSVSDLEQDESLFFGALMENLYLSPKQQADSIFRKVTSQDERSLFEKPVTVISLTRNG